MPRSLILAVAMIVGRIETLVLIALLNPAFWRSLTPYARQVPVYGVEIPWNTPHSIIADSPPGNGGDHA